MPKVPNIDWSGTTKLVVTLALATFGASVFQWLGAPAAPLTGGAATAALAGLAGVRLGAPVWLRNACFLCLGISIGASVSPDVLQSARAWPGSLGVLALTLLLSMLASQWLMRGAFGYDRDTAILATAPGHLSFSIAVAVSGRGDPVAVGLIQSIRLLFLTLCVPPVLLFLFEQGAVHSPTRADLGLLNGAVVLLLALVLGWIFHKLRIPAAFMLAGLIVSGVGHLTDLSPGEVPETALWGALAVLGGMIGALFSGVRWADLRKHALAGLVATFVLLAFAILGAYLAALLTGFRTQLLFAALAPGGVETMAAIAVQTGLDSTFVATHHLARLAILSFLIPLLIGRTVQTGGIPDK